MQISRTDPFLDRGEGRRPCPRRGFPAISAPSISEQIHELERALGEKLFRREGRANRLTDAGQIVFSYADEIFGLGRELLNAVQQRPGAPCASRSAWWIRFPS
jgi:hypothetical protein